MRFWLGLGSLASLAILTAAAPSVARAELGGGKLRIEVKIPSDPDENAGSTSESDYRDPATEDDRTRYFNKARCTCDAEVEDQLYHLRISWETQPTESVSGQLFLWTGTGCAAITDPQLRPNTCTELEVINDVNDVDTVVKRFEYSSELLSPGTNTEGCVDTVVSTAIGVFSSPDGNSLTEEAIYPVMPVDMKPPPVPEEVTVSGEEGQIELSWDRIDSGAEDYAYFQALCSAGGMAAHETRTDAPQFDTTASICEDPIDQFDELAIKNAMEVVGDPVTYGTLPAGLAQLEEAFICGQATGNSTSITLNGLANGVAYTVVLVAMDKAGNYTAGFVPMTVTPEEVTDFWEDLNGDQPDIEGGLCLVEATYGGGDGGLNGALRAWRDDLRQSAIGSWMVDRYYAWGAPLAAAARSSIVARVALGVVMLPLVAIALVWNAIGLPGILALVLAAVILRRRRKLIVTAAVALAPSLAAAQASNAPYWDDELASESAEVSGPRWHFGIRLGPYLPEVDDERFTEPGPYERMFGDGSWLPAADLHRVFNTRFGQIGGGFSVAYFSKTADAFREGSDPPVRAAGNENSLKIVPMELTAIWRGTMFHDNWGIPLVPYARGGLGYYLWWVRRPDGEFAKACPADRTNCDRAIGGSMGLVGAAGLSIRAEGVDPDAARSMRDSGLDHAGFYAEIEVAWVDGFGNAKKLSLGDTTWFAGIDFEF
jgi:hypothetical protein